MQYEFMYIIVVFIVVLSFISIRDLHRRQNEFEKRVNETIEKFTGEKSDINTNRLDGDE